jgi:pimeloyl-ACP methyl ester carboxylesterase
MSFGYRTLIMHLDPDPHYIDATVWPLTFQKRVFGNFVQRLYSRFLLGLEFVQPDWFKQYIDVKPEYHTYRAGGATIAYQHWKNTGKPALLFVHGHAAHAHWWDFIAPAFVQKYDVVAIDSSGSGESDHRKEYSAALFAQEISECISAAHLNATVVIGHSFGGTMTRIAAHLYPEQLDSIVIVDSALPPEKSSRRLLPVPKLKSRCYESMEQGKRRFRLRPPQSCDNKFILDYLAGHSLKKTPKGFEFKLDGAVFAKMALTEKFPAAADMVRDMQIPVGFIYGEKSRFFPPTIAEELALSLDPTLIRVIPDAHHHVFLDQPLRFIEALKDLIPQLNS